MKVKESVKKLFRMASDKVPFHEIVRAVARFPVYTSCENATEYVECLEWLSRFKVDGKYICRDADGKLLLRT